MKPIPMLLLGIVLFFTSCQKGSEAPSPSPSPSPSSANRISLSKATLQVAGISTTDSIDITSSVPWMVEATAEVANWIEVRPASGSSGTSKVKITIRENLAITARQGIVKIKPTGSNTVEPATLTINQSRGYGYALEWKTSLGGASDDLTNNVIATRDGGYLVVSETHSSSGSGAVKKNYGGRDVWVIKLAASGDTLWTRNLGGSGSDIPRFGIPVDDGCLIVFNTNSTDYDLNGFTSSGVYIAKLDLNGNKIWVKFLRSDRSYTAATISVTNDGFVLMGYNVVGNGTLIYLTKIGLTGQIVWDQTHTDMSSVYDITRVSDGYIVTGTVTHPTRSDNDACVIKFNTSGAKQWVKTFGGSGYDNANTIAATADGFIVSGTTASIDGDMPVRNLATMNMFVAKFKPDGSKLWVKVFGGSGATDLIADPSNGCTIAGIADRNNSDVVGHHSGTMANTDAWILKLDTDGNKIWQRAFGGTADDYAASLIPTTNGYVFAGISQSTGDDVGANQGFKDVWLVKLREQ